MSEIILSVSCGLILLVGSFKSTATQRQTMALNAIFMTGTTLAIAAQIFQIYGSGILQLQNILKLYFMVSSILFILYYSKRFRTSERMGILGTVLASCLIISSTNSLFMFCSMSLLFISAYTFSMTRERLSNNQNTLLLYSIISLMLLYKVSPLISLTSLLLISILVFIKTKSRDIETFIIIFTLPMIIYLCIAEFSTPNGALIKETLMYIGLALISLMSLLIISTKEEKIKRSCKYGLFYLGNILLFISAGSQDSVSVAIILMLLIPFIYSQQVGPISILNMAMLPLLPPFIAKMGFAAILIDSNNWIPLPFLLISSLVFWIYGAYDLVRLSPFADSQPKSYRRLALVYLSILVLIATAIFFNYIQDVLKISLESILRKVI